jgi:hypothetical protein
VNNADGVTTAIYAVTQSGVIANNLVVSANASSCGLRVSFGNIPGEDLEIRNNSVVDSSGAGHGMCLVNVSGLACLTPFQSQSPCYSFYFLLALSLASRPLYSPSPSPSPLSLINVLPQAINNEVAASSITGNSLWACTPYNTVASLSLIDNNINRTTSKSAIYAQLYSGIVSGNAILGDTVTGM